MNSLQNSENNANHATNLTYQKKLIKGNLQISNPAPRQTKFNNLKTQKYFSQENTNSFQEALNKYQTHQKCQTMNAEPNTNQVNRITHTKRDRSKNNSLICDKNLLQFAEERSAPKQSLKIEQKEFTQNFDVESEDDINENCAVYPKNKSKGHLTVSTTNMVYLNNESFSSKSQNEKLNTTDIDQVEIKIPENIDLTMFLRKEKLYQEIIKDLEINKMDVYKNKMLIILDFFKLIRLKTYSDICNIFDTKYDSNKKSVLTMSTEYLIQETIFWYLVLLLNNVNHEKNSFLSGLKNCLFYYHQSFLAMVFVVVEKYDNKENEHIKHCWKWIEDNKSWLNKKNYKKIIGNNNKISKSILKNILNQLRIINENNTRLSSDTSDVSKEDDNKFELIIQCFSSYIKKINKIKFSIFLSNTDELPFIKQLFLVSSDELKSQGDPHSSSEDKEESTLLNNTNQVPVPSIPFLEEKRSNLVYTLVLDLDETLVHYIEDKDNAYIQIRPGAEDFILEWSEYFEIIIFTAALQTYGDIVVDGLDPDKKVTARWYRQHTIGIGQTTIKDWSKLGRDLSKIIIVDNYWENFSLQPKNGLHIVNFEGDENDDELDYLKEDLIHLVQNGPEDVREYLWKIQNSMDERAANRMNIQTDSNNWTANSHLNNDSASNENDENNKSEPKVNWTSIEQEDDFEEISDEEK